MKNKEKIIGILISIYEVFYVLPMNTTVLREFVSFYTLDVLEKYIATVEGLNVKLQLLFNKHAEQILLMFGFLICDALSILFLVKKSNTLENGTLRTLIVALGSLLLVHALICIFSILAYWSIGKGMDVRF